MAANTIAEFAAKRLARGMHVGHAGGGQVLLSYWPIQELLGRDHDTGLPGHTLHDLQRDRHAALRRKDQMGCRGTLIESARGNQDQAVLWAHDEMLIIQRPRPAPWNFLKAVVLCMNSIVRLNRLDCDGPFAGFDQCSRSKAQVKIAVACRRRGIDR